MPSYAPWCFSLVKKSTYANNFRAQKLYNTFSRTLVRFLCEFVGTRHLQWVWVQFLFWKWAEVPCNLFDWKRIRTLRFIRRAWRWSSLPSNTRVRNRFKKWRSTRYGCNTTSDTQPCAALTKRSKSHEPKSWSPLHTTKVTRIMFTLVAYMYMYVWNCVINLLL